MLKLVQESGKRLSALFGKRSRRLSARRSTGFAMRRPRPTRRPQIWWGTRARQPTVGRNGLHGRRARALCRPSISLRWAGDTLLHSDDIRWFDARLSSKGREQCERLKIEAADLEFELIVASPLTRALQAQ